MYVMSATQSWFAPSTFLSRPRLSLQADCASGMFSPRSDRAPPGSRGELRRGLPVGFVWGEQDGEVRFHPDEAVRTAIHTVFARFAELGSVRRVWLWLRSEGLSFPLQTRQGGNIRWVDPSYVAIYHVLTNPVYAGAYAYGKSRHEIVLAPSGARKRRVRKLPQSQWSMLIPNHHEGFIRLEHL